MTDKFFDGRASAPGPPGESMPVGARPSESRRGCRDPRCPVCNPARGGAPADPPSTGAPPEPLDDFARAAAETVAEILRKALDPPLTVEQRLDALELEVERQRVELERVGESHAHSLEGA